jgi:hypothetical protein
MTRNRNTMTGAEFQRLKESFQKRLMADPKMPARYFRVGIALSHHMNHETGEAWPGFKCLMMEARVSKMRVVRAIKYHEKCGHIIVTRHHRRPNIYSPQPILEHDLGTNEVIPKGAKSLGTSGVVSLGTNGVVLGGTKRSGTPTSKEPLREPLMRFSDENPDGEEQQGRKEESGGREEERKDGPQSVGRPLSSGEQSEPIPLDLPRPAPDREKIRKQLAELGQALRRGMQ